MRSLTCERPQDSRSGSKTDLLSPPPPARPGRRRAAEATFRALAETADDAIISANSEGSITYWNRGAERMFGHTAAEALVPEWWPAFCLTYDGVAAGFLACLLLRRVVPAQAL